MGFWLTLFWYIVVFIASELLRPKPELENAKPAGLGDFQFPTTTEGRSVPLIWGTVQNKGPNVVWYGDLRQEPIKEKVKTSLFNSETIIKGFRYKVGVQFAFCRGPAVKLLGIWIGDDKVFTGSMVSGDTHIIDKPSLFGGDDLGNGGIVGRVQFFGGEANQAVSEYLDDFQLEGGKTPAYRGTSYLAPGIPITIIIDEGEPTEEEVTYGGPIYLGNSSSIKPWKFELQRIPNGLGLASDGVVNTTDANPMNVIYEIMTDTDWGLGYAASDIDTTSFTAAGDTLATEGNGFSFLLDSPKEAVDILNLLQEQIDGVVFLDAASGKWKVNLARADYDIDTVPELLVSNIHSIENFARASWEETTNQVKVQFNDASDEYKVTYAVAIDMANQRIQNGVNVTTTMNFPGVKNATLANTLAWRELRSVSYPLAKAKIVVDRTFFNVQPAQVLAFTDPDLNFTKLPLRVNRIDFGSIADNKITLDLVQDIYSFQQGVFGPPPDSGWEPPADDLAAFSATYQMAMEAPRGFVMRDPGFVGYTDKVWTTARRVGVEVGFQIRERHAAAPSAPTGSFNQVGTSYGLVLIGQLDSSLDAGSAFPLTSLLVSPTPDLQSSLESQFNDAATLSDVGTNLINLVMVNNEFMLVAGGAQVSATKVQLNSVYRGVLDSVQADHAGGDLVWLLFAGGNLADTTFDAGDNVDIKLLPFSLSDTVLEDDATTIQIQPMDNRVRRPYCPSSVTFGAALWPSTTSLEANGTGAENYAIDLNINRRDYRTLDEITALTTDAADLFTDFPTANSTDQQVEVRNDPAGSNTLLYTDTFTNAQHDVKRIDILRYTDGVVPSTLRFVLRSRHTEESVVYTSRQELTWDFSITTALSGQFEFGALDTNDVSSGYTVAATGRFSFTLSSAFTTGDIEYDVDGAGSWTTLISAGSTSANPSFTSGSVITLRHTSTDAGALKQLDMDGSGTDGFAILFT